MKPSGRWGDLHFLAVAAVLHAWLLAVDPALRWSAALGPAPAAAPIPIEFVAAPPPPPPSPLLAPVPPGGGREDALPGRGPGPVVAEKIKRGSPIRDAFRRARRKALRAARAASRERARAAALARAEADRRRRQEIAERKAALARERALLLARARAEKARQRAELERQLAMLPDPDERVSDAVSGDGRGPEEAEAPPPAGARSGRPRGALPETADPLYDPQGGEGADDSDARPAGGGIGEKGGGPVSWSLEGPVGSRRLLRRALPAYPGWAAERGLEFAVQVKFQVLADGSVKPEVVIKKTSGFPDVDRRAVEALRRWRFEPVPAGSGPAPEIWGIVSFRFLMG